MAIIEEDVYRIVDGAPPTTVLVERLRIARVNGKARFKRESPTGNVMEDREASTQETEALTNRETQEAIARDWASLKAEVSALPDLDPSKAPLVKLVRLIAPKSER